jgi:O-antigen/teichoic acid export membrane protein
VQLPLRWGRFLTSGLNEPMENEKNRDRSNVHYIKRPKRVVSRTRLVMGLLLIVALPIFIGLANKAVRENTEAIRQEFGR